MGWRIERISFGYPALLKAAGGLLPLPHSLLACPGLFCKPRVSTLCVTP
jgi:hypothetical protein